MASYEELIKDDDYQRIANILLNDPNAKKDNRVLLKEYYRSIGLTLDEAFSRNDVPNYQSIERKARLLKATNHCLKVDKSKQVDMYKDIGLQRVAVTTLF